MEQGTIGPGVASGGVGAPAGGVVPAVAMAGGVGMDGDDDDDDIVLAELAAPGIHAAALGQGDVPFLRDKAFGVEAEGEEAVHDAGGDEAVSGVFPEHSVGRAPARRLDAETGHRIKDESQPNRITWVHSLMKQFGQLPADWQLTQCLFGEHLLAQHPGKTVALVESEKTIVICAGIMPRFLWLAAGGKSQINERLLILKGRKIVAYPDIDGYATWIEKLAQFPDLHVTVSPILQRNATAEDIDGHIDIADWFIREKLRPTGESIKQHSKEFLLAAQYHDPEKADEVEALIEDLGLMFMGAEKVEEEGEDLSPQW